MGASRLRMLWDVVLPSALPELLNGIRTALALSFILLVSSELIVAREGLGYLIGFLGANGTYDAMFAVVLTVALLGFAADRVYLMLMRRVLRWREQIERDGAAMPGTRRRAALAHRPRWPAGVSDRRCWRRLGGVRAQRRGHAVHAAAAQRGAGAHLERRRRGRSLRSTSA